MVGELEQTNFFMIEDDIYQTYVLNENTSWARSHLGASQLGNPCARSVWYSFHWCSEPSFVSNGRILRLFETGNLEESRILFDLKNIGIEILSTQTQSTDEECKIISGSCDGIARGFKEHPDERVLLEFKTSNTKSFKKIQKNGMRAEKPIHYVQMNVYMKWLDIKFGLYMVVCKETDEIYTEWVDFDENTADEFLIRGRKIVESQIPPDKPSNKMTSDCMFCDHKNLCWETQLPLLHCRTCMYCQYDLNRQKFICEQGNWYIDDVKIFYSECHKINPYLLNKWSFVDIITDEDAFVMISPFGGIYDTRNMNSLTIKTKFEQEKQDFIVR
jgi:hypothetical protein